MIANFLESRTYCRITMRSPRCPFSEKPTRATSISGERYRSNTSTAIRAQESARSRDSGGASVDTVKSLAPRVFARTQGAVSSGLVDGARALGRHPWIR